MGRSRHLYSVIPWKIYYADDSVVQGKNYEDWKAAPDEGVVGVVVFAAAPSKPPGNHRSLGLMFCDKKDKTFYFGATKYDPFSYGHQKKGRLLGHKDRQEFWKRILEEN